MNYDPEKLLRYIAMKWKPIIIKNKVFWVYSYNDKKAKKYTSIEIIDKFLDI